jgi:hypothetical protein
MHFTAQIENISRKLLDGKRVSLKPPQTVANALAESKTLGQPI